MDGVDGGWDGVGVGVRSVVRGLLFENENENEKGNQVGEIERIWRDVVRSREIESRKADPSGQGYGDDSKDDDGDEDDEEEEEEDGDEGEGEGEGDEEEMEL